MQPTPLSSTRLFYKDGGQTTDEGEIFIRSKRTKLSKKNHRLNSTTVSQSSSQLSTNAEAETETAAIKKRKKKKRSYNLHKKKATAAAAGVSITSEELCSHVQSVFSDLKEYENSSSDCDTEEELDSYQKEVGRRGTMKEQQQHDKGVMKQNSIMLDRHPALVLNADYQPLRMLPLSVWSWQDTVKAVLSGKAVVVDIYPDLYVRAVSLDIPVPSVIALREYAPTGKAVSYDIVAIEVYLVHVFSRFFISHLVSLYTITYYITI